MTGSDSAGRLVDAGESGGNTASDVQGDVTQFRDVHGDVHIGRLPGRRWPRVVVGAAGALIVVAAATIRWLLVDRGTSPVQSGATDPAPHLSIATSVNGPCGYLVPDDGGQRGCADGSAVMLKGQNNSSAEFASSSRLRAPALLRATEAWGRAGNDDLSVPGPPR